MWKTPKSSLLFFVFILLSRASGLPSNSMACTGTGTVGASDAKLSSISGTSFDTNIAFGYIAETPEYTFDCCGVITAWKLKSGHQGSISLQVWRRTGVTEYTMVGENYFSVTASSSVLTYNVDAVDQIVFKPGDMIGWRSAGEEMIVFEAAAHFTESGYPNLFRRINTGDLFTGSTYDWSTIEAYNDRYYAIQASWAASSAPVFTLTTPVSVVDSAGIGTSVARVLWSDADLKENGSLSVVQTSGSAFYTFDTSSGTVTSNPPNRLRDSAMEYLVYDTCYNYDLEAQNFNLQAVGLVIQKLPASVTVEERASAQTLLFTLTVTDASSDQVYCEPAWTTEPFFIAGATNLVYELYLSEDPGLVYATTSTYTLNINCYENRVGGLSSPTTGTVTVNVIPNTPPSITNLDATATVNALTAFIGDTVFTVTATDPEGDALTFTKSCTPGSDPFLMLTSGHIQLTSLLLHHGSTQYDCDITVSDGLAADGPNKLYIDISNINDQPVFRNVPASVRVKENTPLGTYIHTFSIGDLDATDTHIMTATFSDTRLSRLFNLDRTTFVLTTANSVIDFEEFGSANPTFTLTLKVTDDDKSVTSQDVTIDISNENEAPFFDQDDYDINADEGVDGTVITPKPTLVASDPDVALSSDVLTYSLDCGSTTDTYRFNVDGASGTLSYNGDYDLDTSGTPTDVTCTLTVTDKFGLSDTATLNIHINYANEFAPQFEHDAYTFYADTSMLVGTSVFQMSATDRDVDVNRHAHLTYSFDQTMLSDPYFAIDNNGDVYIIKDLPGSNLIFNAIVRNQFATPALSSTASVTVYIPSTTTQATSTTTTERYLGFEESYQNVIWLTLAVGGAAALVLVLIVALFRVIRHNTPRIFIDGFWCCKRELLPHEIGFGDQEYDWETFGRPHQYDDQDPLPPDAWYRHAVAMNQPKRVVSPVGPEKVQLESKKKRSVSPQPDDSISQVAMDARNVSFTYDGQRYGGPGRNNRTGATPLYEMFRIPSKTEPKAKRGWVN